MQYNSVAGSVERAIMESAETVGSGSLREYFVTQQISYPAYVDSAHPFAKPADRPSNVVRDVVRHQAIFYDVVSQMLFRMCLYPGMAATLELCVLAPGGRWTKDRGYVGHVSRVPGIEAVAQPLCLVVERQHVLALVFWRCSQLAFLLTFALSLFCDVPFPGFTSHSSDSGGIV
ncbi:hypothetical protein BCR43DRAFT_506018 [Syncephalastrum racemosum]|uniref:Uncharacterized protein n=1 Tax=Syncephalastrum racemosum TaxID=13706 RepID=A0A1X2HA50_SYNRA|nr:hypothetical protein BCR43DRAFT_506018 [Syncephalastrum racemosum]